jgi:hypothetical protein
VRERTIPSILADSEALCRIIAPEEQTLNFVYYVSELPGRPLCEVECDRKDGACIATFTFNADTAELYVVGCSWGGSPRRAPLMGDIRTVRSACYWLQTLHIAHDVKAWHASTVLRGSSLAGISLAGEGRRAFVEIDGRTGDLIHAIVKLCKRPSFLPVRNRLVQGSPSPSGMDSRRDPPA